MALAAIKSTFRTQGLSKVERERETERRIHVILYSASDTASLCMLDHKEVLWGTDEECRGSDD